MTKFLCLVNLSNLPTEVASRPLLIYLFISGVLELQIMQGQTRWKANIFGYNFSEETSPKIVSTLGPNPFWDQDDESVQFSSMV